MKTSKKVFIIIVIGFCIALAFISYDISKRTTFPGSHPQLKERLEEKYLKQDSLKVDSLLHE